MPKRGNHRQVQGRIRGLDTVLATVRRPQILTDLEAISCPLKSTIGVPCTGDDRLRRVREHPVDRRAIVHIPPLQPLHCILQINVIGGVRHEIRIKYSHAYCIALSDSRYSPAGQNRQIPKSH